MWWGLSVATVLLVAIATSTEASWKWDEGTPENATHTASTVTSSSSSTSTSSSTTTVTKPDTYVAAESQKVTQAPTEAGERASAVQELDGPANDTDPRFIGGLKKKLCSIGLGINKGELYECKGTGLKKKVRVLRETKEDKAEPSPRLLGLLGGLSSGSGLDGTKSPAFVPTFGVNFGSLPTGGGYSPYGGGNSNPLGLDIGPVSINPFVGFKVASLDGRPVFSPNLDLLVTPNAQGVHALQGIKEKIKHQFSPNKGYSPHGGGGYPHQPYPGGHYPSSGYQQGGGYYPGGGQYSGAGQYPGVGQYPIGGGQYPGGGQYHGSNYPTGSLYPQTGGYQSSIYSPQTYVPPQSQYRPPYTPPRPAYTPPYTPPKPAYRPPYTPPKPAYRPPYTPPKPAYRPPYTPPKPVYTPSKPAYSPQIYNPPRPQPIADYTPSRPSYTPSRPSYTPSRPSYTPSRPSHTPPSNPIYTPSRPVHTPSEVHHHEHTHFHDHDHDNNGPFNNHNGFDPIFRGRSDVPKDEGSSPSRLPTSRPIASSASSSFSPSTSGAFAVSASNPATSFFSARSDTKKSSSGSSFKFPDK